MASSIIHMVIAKKINKTIKRNEEKLLIGSVAPDISKCLNQTKLKSHFLDSENDDIPNINKFLNKYQNKLNDDFVMGYYIHLYTDYLWFKFFIPEIIKDDNIITKLNGDTFRVNDNMKLLYIYNDYTNLNIQLINKYNLDLEFFYNKNNNKIPNIIEEIPYKELDILYDSIIKIIENTKLYKSLIFNIQNIEKFIDTATELILSEIEKITNLC